jgi:acyl-coenzyme A thioesterase PaaI-like protein
LTITHHELCFGCGLANLFGLQLELERDGADRVAGRFFLKQDHQGPPGFAHGGILATALDEAMALLVHDEGMRTLTRRLAVEFLAPAPIGAFAHVSAWVEERDEKRLRLAAELRSDAVEDRPVATANAEFARI